MAGFLMPSEIEKACLPCFDLFPHSLGTVMAPSLEWTQDSAAVSLGSSVWGCRDFTIRLRFWGLAVLRFWDLVI